MTSVLERRDLDTASDGDRRGGATLPPTPAVEYPPPTTYDMEAQNIADMGYWALKNGLRGSMFISGS